MNKKAKTAKKTAKFSRLDKARSAGWWRKRLAAVLAEISAALSQIPAEEILPPLVRRLARAKRVFVAGAGRTGLVMRMFAMRLTQCGLGAHVAGDATTPAIGKGDLFVLASGSGATATMIALARAARAAGADIILLTARPRSPLARLIKWAVRLPLPLALHRPAGLASSQLLGSCFEQSLLVFCDLLTEEVARTRRQSEEDFARRHANLE